MIRHWFTDIEGGFHLVDSADEARAGAARELATADEGAWEDGWPDGVAGIRWGAVLGEVREVESGVDDRGCKLCCGPVDSLGRCVDPLCAEVTPIEEWVRYALVDAARPPLPPVAPGHPELVARLLEPQPAPTGDGPSVVDWLIADLSMTPTEPRADLLIALLRARREQGLARYGTEVRAHNGRWATADALQEAVDMLVYVAQRQIERGGPHLGRLATIYSLVRWLAEEGERELREGETADPLTGERP